MRAPHLSNLPRYGAISSESGSQNKRLGRFLNALDRRVRRNRSCPPSSHQATVLGLSVLERLRVSHLIASLATSSDDHVTTRNKAILLIYCSMLVLTPEQRENLKKYGHDYVTWLNTNNGRENIRDHREHERYFREKLSPENIRGVTESQFREVYKTLWASRLWSDKDWYVTNKLIAPNGLEKIKTYLHKLLYGKEDIATRYDEFIRNVKGFGTASLSELLHMVYPDRYCLWNEVPKTVLPFLGLDEILPKKFFNSQLSNGSEYIQCVQALEGVKKELTEFGVKDFIDLDIYFWHLSQDIIPREARATPQKVKPEKGEAVTAPARIKIDSHEAVEYYLLELGRVLGYLPYTVDQSKTFQGKRLGDVALLRQIPPFAGERDMKTVKEIDVLWFNEDQNPEYSFEVEHTTDIVHGLDRQIQLQHLYVKFVIVAPEEKREKYESLLDRVQYRRIRDRFRFISYDELADLYARAVAYHQLRVKLLGEV